MHLLEGLKMQFFSLLVSVGVSACPCGLFWPGASYCDLWQDDSGEQYRWTQAYSGLRINLLGANGSTLTYGHELFSHPPPPRHAFPVATMALITLIMNHSCKRTFCLSVLRGPWDLFNKMSREPQLSNCDSLYILSPESSTIKRCGFVGVGVALWV